MLAADPLEDVLHFTPEAWAEWYAWEAEDAGFEFVVDAEARPGNVLPALARLLLSLADDEGGVDPTCSVPRDEK